MKIAFASLLLLISMSCGAQSNLNAQQAYNYLQNERHRAEAVVGNGTSSSMDSLRKSAGILQEALLYYARPEVQQLTKTDQALFFRKSDILFDLAIVQSKLGEKAMAVTSLQQILAPEFNGVYAKYILEEPAFATLLQHASIKGMLDQATALDQVFNSPALKTPYQPNISVAEKLAGLSLFWSEAKYNFAYFDQVPGLNWDQLYLDYIPKVQATTSTLAYYYLMEEFCARLSDGHTSIWAKDAALADLINGRPPLRTRLVEDKVMITNVFSDSLVKAGLKPGLEVLKIDGLPVKEYATQRVQPYQSSSTPQDLTARVYIYSLLRGPRKQPVTLELKDARGKVTNWVLPRSGYGKLKTTESVSFRILPGNIAYLVMNEFESDEASKKFAAIFDSLSTTHALILDVRQNGGGDSDVGHTILGYLTDKSFETGSYSSRIYSPLKRARGEGIILKKEEVGKWAAHGEKLYTRPVVVLISPQTYSAAEDFAVAFDAMQRGKLIGEATGGSTGQPLPFALPGGMMARICTKRDTYPNGKKFVGVGIQPQITVKPTVKDLLAGRDTVLEAALTYLGAKKTGKK